MKTIKQRAAALLMLLAMTVSLSVGALAYSTPDFADVPAGNWAYEPVMKMADAGVIKGSSATTFAPEVKVSPAMWLTLVGRAVYEADVKAATTAEDNWYSAYARVAVTKGLLTGTAIDKSDIEGEMTRYDMAATVYAAIKLLGTKDATVDTAAIKDYGDIPQKYLAAVGQMYATGLIKGDGAGNFNGNNTMTRAEAATVMDRLITLKTKLVEEANKPPAPVEPETPRTGEMVTLTVKGYTYFDNENNKEVRLPNAQIAVYYKDGRELGKTVSDNDGNFNLSMTVDKADYTSTGNVYYVLASGVDPKTGIEYASSPFKPVRNLFDNDGSWEIRLADFFVGM